MYAPEITPRLRLALAAAALLVLGSPSAWARPGDTPGRRQAPDPVLRRLRPLQMNFHARAHIRGVSTDTATRKDLMAEVVRREGRFAPAWTTPVEPTAPGASPRRAAPRPPRAAPTPAASRPPRGPRIRVGVGYPVPPWLAGIRLPDIPIRFSSQVYRYLAHYRTDAVGRAVLRAWLGRMKRFEPHIRAELRRHGLPQALLYVAMIESGFRPTTVSRAGAAGLWQFMPFGGAIYGLKRSFWVDERFNPDRSTRAVMYYFKDLHRRFGNWEMALAAYNAGYGAMMRAIRKYNTNDYWRLCDYEAGMPYETMAYVPKLYAIAVIAENLGRFDLAPRRPAESWEYALASAPGGTSLANLARMTGVPLATLKELNPELLRGRVPPGPAYEVRLPAKALAVYRRVAARQRAGQRALQSVVVRYGDSVESIARAHRIAPALLRRINEIRSQREVRPGVVLLVPAPGRRGRPAAPPETRIVALPEVAPPSPAHRAVYYPVVAGDGLDDVAKALGVTPAELVRWNALSPDTLLLPGLVIRAYLPKDRAVIGVRLLDAATLQVVTVNSKAFHELHLGRASRRRLVIRARRTDTMKRIAARYGISVGSLARENKLARNARLRPGQTLVVYTKAPRRRPKRRRR